jgi:N-acetylmuramoyl-L-alanine amidase
LAVAVRDSMTAAGYSPANYVGSNGLNERTDLGTLNRSARPAVLVEMGNLKNSSDANELVSNAGQDRMAAALTAGIRRYLGG